MPTLEELWAVGIYDLGLSEQQFWALTLRQLDMLLGRAQRAEERADYRTGIIAATIANAFRSKKGKAFSPEDFMPRQRQKKAVQPKTTEEMLAIVEMLNVAFGGEDKRGDRDSAAIRNGRE